MNRDSSEQQPDPSQTASGNPRLSKRKRRHLPSGMERLAMPEAYWEEDPNEETWRDEVGNSGRKPSLDEYDRWNR